VFFSFSCGGFRGIAPLTIIFSQAERELFFLRGVLGAVAPSCRARRKAFFEIYGDISGCVFQRAFLEIKKKIKLCLFVAF
jgi:hypothetical protein